MLWKKLRLNLPGDFELGLELFLLFDFDDQALDTLRHAVERSGKLAQLIPGANRYTVGEVPGFDLPGPRVEIMDCSRDGTRELSARDDGNDLDKEEYARGNE